MIYAEIENSIVINTILLTDENKDEYIRLTGKNLVPCKIEHEDVLDTEEYSVARIGEAYLDDKFINGNQAVELGYLTVEEAKTFGFHSGQEYKQTLEDELNILKDKILALNPTATFPNDVDTDGNNLASKEELEAYLKLLQEKALLSKFEG